MSTCLGTHTAVRKVYSRRLSTNVLLLPDGSVNLVSRLLRDMIDSDPQSHLDTHSVTHTQSHTLTVSHTHTQSHFHTHNHSFTHTHTHIIHRYVNAYVPQPEPMVINIQQP